MDRLSDFIERNIPKKNEFFKKDPKYLSAVVCAVAKKDELITKLDPASKRIFEEFLEFLRIFFWHT